MSANSIRPTNSTVSSARRVIGRWQLAILIGLTLVRGLIYLSIFPPWIGPDEPAHFEAIRIINQAGDFPTEQYYKSTSVDPRFAQSMQTFRLWEYSERSTPHQSVEKTQPKIFDFMEDPYPGGIIMANRYAMLPYTLLKPVSILIEPLNMITELYALRFMSLLMGVGVTILAWLITRQVFYRQPQFWLAIPAFIVFLPMRTHIFATVNTDVFAILLVTAILWLIVSIFYNGLSRTRVVALLLLTLLTLFIKRTTLFAIVWVGVAAILYLGYRRKWPASQLLFGGAVTLVLFAGLLLLALSNASSLSMVNISLFNFGAFERGLSEITFATANLSGSEILDLIFRLALFAHITFWGVFGFNNISIPWEWNYILLGITLLLAIGALIYVFRTLFSNQNQETIHSYIIGIFAVGVMLALLSAFFPGVFRGLSWGPQARYYFPALVPLATFFFLGAWQLCPARFRQVYLLPIWLVSLILYDSVVVVQVLNPFFYG